MSESTLTFLYGVMAAALPALLLYYRNCSLLRRNTEKHEKSLSQARDEIQKLIDQHVLLTENLAAAIISRNAAGKIVFCSPFTEVLTGYALEEIYNSEEDFFLSIVHEDDRENYKRALKVSASGEPFQFRYRFFHKSGILMWAETRTVPIAGEHGEITASLSITFDVTGTVLYQRQVEEKNRDLQDFTYMISHDLKAPIATIKGMLSVIEENGQAGDKELIEPLGHVARATKRLEQLVASFLEYARLSNQEFASGPVPVETVIKDVSEDLSAQYASCGATLEVEGTLPLVVGDRIRLYQVFGNLLGNALKYRRAQEPLKVKVETRPSPNPRYVTIVVKDNGLGIPADKLTSVFRPFFRISTQSVDGMGIGLACVKKVVEKCGGSVSVESKVEEGSSFLVTLKRA